jgi:glycosyltransferase involved in cell wall biosynthesis
MPKVLIITYYWPPCGGSSVLRWLKFTKYLRDFGWEPVIYTPANPEPQETDPLLTMEIPPGIEVITSTIYEPYTLYKWLTGKKKQDHLGVSLMKDQKGGMIQRISLWLRSNLFIPDPRRLWVWPSVRKLSNYLRQNPVDIIVTTGPPHSMHLIGLGLHTRFRIKWVADFRDPWTNIDFYSDLALTRFADRLHKKLEKKVLLKADHVITVSPGMTRDFRKLRSDNITTITNGFDEEPHDSTQPVGDRFTLLHLGSMPGSRNPLILWKALSGLVKENAIFASRLEIRLIGKQDVSVLDSISRHQLQNYVVHTQYVPHSQTYNLLTTASVLLLCINDTPNARGILTNKFFEYLSANRPILAIGPADGDASQILNETGAGRIFEYGEARGLQQYVLDLFELYSQHNLDLKNQHLENYSRRNLTRNLAELLNNTIA